MTNLEVYKLKRALENLQLKYGQEIKDHGIEIQDILNNFAFEKESLICDFTEEDKAELLDLQNKTKRRETSILQNYTERTEQLEKKYIICNKN